MSDQPFCPLVIDADTDLKINHTVIKVKKEHSSEKNLFYNKRNLPPDADITGNRFDIKDQFFRLLRGEIVKQRMCEDGQWFSLIGQYDAQM